MSIHPFLSYVLLFGGENLMEYFIQLDLTRNLIPSREIQYVW
jgi:hypothetical protein